MTLMALSSKDIQGPDRRDAAVEIYSRVGTVHIATTRDQTGFDFNARLFCGPFTVIGTLNVAACKASRTPAHIADENGFDVLGIAEGPGVEVALKGGARFTYGQGDAFLWRGDQVGSSRYRGASTPLLNVAIRRDLLHAALADPQRIAGRRLPASAELQLLAGYLKHFMACCDRLSPEATALAERHIQDLLYLALGANRDTAHAAQSGGLRAARMQTIMQDIETHLLDPALCVSWIIGRHRISERYLRALFATQATTFTDYVTNRRLLHAFRHLTDPGQWHRPVSDIAYASGFGDLSWFNRSFRRRFGMTPSEAREQARHTAPDASMSR
ncbi:MAG: helix-turn-helix transcriptional regulator [Rhodocyclaceae bacterium]